MGDRVEKVKAAADGLSVFERFMELLKKYGVFKTIGGAIVLVIVCYLAYIAANPAAMFKRYENYISEQHAISSEYRVQTYPMIRRYLNNLAAETGADRAFIIEYHNGKNNPTGLQWQYGDMTFLNDSATEDISDEYQNISLSRYPIFYEIFQNTTWNGYTEEMQTIDKRFALRAEANGINYMALETIYGPELIDVGALGLSFSGEPLVTPQEIVKILQKYSTSLAPLLDGNRAFEKKK